MPRKKCTIDRALFEDLMGIGCTKDEVRWMFRDKNTGRSLSASSLDAWVKQTYNMGFGQYKDECGCVFLKVTLRRYQLDQAKRSPVMAIWLGKQYLGQRDDPDVNRDVTVILDMDKDDPKAPVDDGFAKAELKKVV